MRTRFAIPLGTLLSALAACADPGVSPADQRDPHHPASASALVVPAAQPTYTQLDGAAARGTRGSLHLTVNTGGAIPRFPDAFILSVPVFGYAWVDVATGRGVVAVIHPAIGRDSRQNPQGWHTHPVLLGAGTASSNFCIGSIGTSQGGISIQGEVLRLNMALRQAGIPAAALDAAAAFAVQPDAGCPPTGLGVVVLDLASL